MSCVACGLVSGVVLRRNSEMFCRPSSWTFGSVCSRTVDVLGWCFHHSTGLLS